MPPPEIAPATSSRVAASPGSAILDIFVMYKDCIRAPRSEVFAIFGSPRLEDNRLALCGARDVEWSFHLEEFALVVELMQLSRVKEYSALFIMNERIVSQESQRP
ncbi:hypothetical protein ASD32_14705 [Rhizobium sp. Root483D2]|nr:hypothetical protein ASD32_14705 [Rhizobium sp. Root483D2]